MDTLPQKPHRTSRDVGLLSDQELYETIARMFNNWCWISGDPDEKLYYDRLLAEADKRKATQNQEPTTNVVDKKS
ncbi:MAG: hypothetical protein ACFCVA_13230 [Gammaproteobacteria bacterium]